MKGVLVNGFSEKSLLALGDFYVYGLVDPRNHQIFYVGKGCRNRVFEHEKESLKSRNSEKWKLKTIDEIKSAGLEVEKIIINCGLTEDEAFVAEAALINALNYTSNTGLTNEVSGHHSKEALSVENFERKFGAEELQEKDLKHRIMFIKINRLYKRDMPEEELYDIVRGVWSANIENAKKAEYVFGVYNSLIVAVYKPTKWYRCNEVVPEQLPRQNRELEERLEKRVFFVDEGYENGVEPDENQKFYIYKSLAEIGIIKKTQNSISYWPRDKK